MKTNFKNWLAAAVSAAVTLSAMGSLSFFSAETTDEQTTYSLSFNLSFEGFETETPELFEAVQLSAGEVFTVPEGAFITDTISSTGWTTDNIYILEAGDYFTMPDHDVILEPVFVDYSDPTTYTVSYNITGEDYSVLDDTPFKSREYQPGQAVKASGATIFREGYTQYGWTYEGNDFYDARKLIMPDHDVVFEPHWYQHHMVYYEAGDVDGIRGNAVYSFEKTTSVSIELGDSSRLSRTGYSLTGWICDLDGQTYSTGARYIMPDSDVHFTAIWTPNPTTVSFKSATSANETLKLSAKTEDVITIPECTFTNEGYIFIGWNYNGTIYTPGEEFTVPGSLFGTSLKAVWAAETDLYDSLSLCITRKNYAEGNVSEEELKSGADYLLCRSTNE